MVFKNRDDLLQARMENLELTDADIGDIIREQNKVQEPTKTIIGYVTDIAALLKGYRLDQQYGIFGGYAVLAQLVSRFGDSVISAWRGSDDIDMFGTMDVLNAIRSSYTVTNDRPSPNVSDKVTLKVFAPDEAECKIDYVFAKKSGQAYQTEVIPVLGVPIVVSKPLDLVKAKIELAQGERKQLADVESLLGVLEYRRTSVDNVSAALSTPLARQLYQHVVKLTDFEPVRLTTGPSLKYLRDLKQELKSRT